MTNAQNSKTATEQEQGVMSPLDFARLGDGHVAYVKQVKTGEAVQMFPAAKGLPDGIDLYALVSADGTPLSLRDNRDSAVGDAIENNLETVSIH